MIEKKKFLWWSVNAGSSYWKACLKNVVTETVSRAAKFNCYQVVIFIMSVLNVKIVWKIRINLVKTSLRIFWHVFLCFVFLNHLSRFIYLLFSFACCFLYFVHVIIFNNSHTFCILQSENYLFVFFMINKRKSDCINVNIHENKIILYILVLASFLKWFRFKF